MGFQSTQWIKNQGFNGFKTIAELQVSKLMSVPKSPGVYLILKNHITKPEFLAKSPAGWFKGKDPSIDPVELRMRWISESPILYIGKAGSSGSRSTLRSRIKSYLSHGEGRKVGHWGGRAIWQLIDSEQLIVSWRIICSEEPREFEKRWLEKFQNVFGSWPFANRTG